MDTEKKYLDSKSLATLIGKIKDKTDEKVAHPTSAVHGRIAVFDDTTGSGKAIKDSGYTIAKSVPANAVFTDSNYYPTTFTWTNGTSTAGPTGSLTGSGMSAVSFGAIPSATIGRYGVVKLSNSFNNSSDSEVATAGAVNAAYQSLSALIEANKYTLPIAASGTLGGVKIGSNINVDSNGVISLTKSNVTSALGFTPVSNSTATQSAAGLMSAADKTKLDGITTGATANKGTVTSVATGAGLTGGTITSSGTIKCNLNSETSLGTIGSTSKLYAVGVDANNKLCVKVPWTDNNTTYSVATESTDGLMSKTTAEALSSYSSYTFLYNVTGNVTPGSDKVNVHWTQFCDYVDYSKNDFTENIESHYVDFDIPTATTSLAGVMSAADKSKLDSLSTSTGSMNISGTVNLTNGTFNTQNNTSLNSYTKVFEDMSVGEMRMYLVADSSGNLPSTSETAVTVPHDGVLSPAQVYFGKSAAFGVSVGDICVLFKRSSIFNVCRIIPLNDVKPANGDFPGADGLSTVWDKNRINKIDGIEWTANHVRDNYLPKSDSFPSRADWLINVDNCIDSGVYPTCDTSTLNLGLTNQYSTIVVHKTSTVDNGGYDTIEQTVYGRGADEGQIYKRVIFINPTVGDYQYLKWKRVDNNYNIATTEEDGLMSAKDKSKLNGMGNPLRYISYNNNREVGDANIVIIRDGDWQHESPDGSSPDFDPDHDNAVIIPEPSASYEGRIITIYNRVRGDIKRVYLTTTTRTSDWAFNWENWHYSLAGKAKTVLICESEPNGSNKCSWIVLESN